MIASSESINEEPLFPNSKRIYSSGTIHKDIEVAMREISLSQAKDLMVLLKKMNPLEFTILLVLGEILILKEMLLEVYHHLEETGY